MKSIDIVIIGAGPAGMTAGIYALRANKKVVLLEKEAFGGQMARSPLIENYPGAADMPGAYLACKMYDQILKLEADVEFDEALSITQANQRFIVTTENETYDAGAVIIATGSEPNRLGIANESKFIGKGIYFCATCDGPLYKNKRVAVIGDGNTAAQYALDLSNYCEMVFMISNTDHLFCESKLSEKIAAKSNIEVLYDLNIDSFNAEGDIFTGLYVKNKKGIPYNIDVAAAFLAIGQKPTPVKYNSSFNEIAYNSQKYIIADESCTTSVPGIFVAGDCRTKKMKQVVGATSDGAMAAIQAIKYLEK